MRINTDSPLLYGEVSYVQNDITKGVTTKVVMPTVLFKCFEEANYGCDTYECVNGDVVILTEISRKTPSHTIERVEKLLSYLYEKMDELVECGMLHYSDVHPFVYYEELPF